MNIVITQAGHADVAELAVIFDEYRQFQGQVSNICAAQEFLGARVHSGESIAFIARDAGVCVGFAQLYPTYSSVHLARVFILNDLFVREPCRRIGVASKLLNAAENFSIALGAVRLSLSVDTKNLNGQSLYQSKGWLRDQQYYVYHRGLASSVVSG